MRKFEKVFIYYSMILCINVLDNTSILVFMWFPNCYVTSIIPLFSTELMGMISHQ